MLDTLRFWGAPLLSAIPQKRCKDASHSKRTSCKIFFSSVSSANRDDGNSEMEDKAAKGSGERLGKRSEFQIRGSAKIKNFPENVDTTMCFGLEASS